MFFDKRITTHTQNYMKKLGLMLMLTTALTTFFTSCSKQEQIEVTPTAFKAPVLLDTITNFYVHFSDPIDSATEVGAYEDIDGPGPMEGAISGVSLKANTHYIVTFMMEDATNPENPINIQNKIRTYGKDYRLCISNQLGMAITPTDSDGVMPIGLVNELNTTSTTGDGSISFTLKYQKGVKNGDCSPGTVVYKCTIPISVY
jgi:hypothetical protein